MLAKRIIPCLDVDQGRVVKGVNFVGIRDAGDPVEIAKRYNDAGADEITFLDITASHQQYLNLNSINLIFSENWLDLLSGVMLTSATKGLQLAPYQTMWITNKY